MKIAKSTKSTLRIILVSLFVFILSSNNNIHAQNNPEWMYFRSGIVGLANSPVYQIAIDDSLNKWCLIDFYYLCKLKDSSWSIYNGPGIYLRSMSIDNDGVKWIGTSSGLMKFDGEKFVTTNPEIPLNSVISVITDRFNNKWLLTDAGLVKYDNLNWTIIDSLVSENQTEGHYFDKLVCDSANNIWIASDTFLIKYSSKSKSKYTLADFGCPNNYIRSIQADPIGNLWLGSDRNLIKIGDKNHQVFMPDDSIIPYILSGFRNIGFDKSNNVWIAALRFGLIKFDGTNWTYFTRKNSNYKFNQFHSIAIDKLGNIWLGLEFADVHAYRKGGVLLDVSENLLNNFSEFSLSPNPANDFIQISCSPISKSGLGGVSVEVYNVFGQRVLTTPALRASPTYQGEDNLRLNVSGLTPGFYFVKCGDTFGKFLKSD